MMQMEHRMVQSQQQRLMLTQKMQQAIQILQLSGLELEQYIQEELENNPTLELKPKKEEEKPNSKETDTSTSDDTKALDDGDFDLDDYASHFTDRLKEGRDLSYNPDNFDRLQYYEDSISREESLSSRLMSQLRFATNDDETQAIGERIIGDIDYRGYFTGSLEEIAEDANVPFERVEDVLRLIQSFEPTGVGARTVIECLLLQIEAECPSNDQLKRLVSQHLEELQRRQIPKIAKDMGISPEQVEDLKETLSGFDPWPGLEYDSTPTQYVTPDLVVEKDENDKWVVNLTNERVPELNISSHYRRMAKNGNLKKDEKAYVKQKVESAKWLIRNIEQRQSTILRIGRAIMDVQKNFLEKGPEAIRPLTLQEIADKVNVHEATVSRTTRGKYIQTPQGLYELKYFFSPALKHASGEDQSAKSVQQKIKQIVDEEDKSKPLSDQKIVDILKKEGLKIARRTVTKYREALDIPSSTMRKSY